jgi:alkanesulfonate monooxygenase SsuD/methylene tetrahydromethanopterin reductase-like flavin-dependent oxidoreductase (luciferase family)
LASYLGPEIEDLPLDEPIPAWILDREVDPATFARSLGYRQTIVTWARARGQALPLRAMVREFGGYGARIVVGTPEQAADSIEEWYRSGAADGFNLMIDEFPRGLETVVDHLVPILRAKGIFHHEYEDTTLRGRFRARAGLRPGVHERTSA